MEDKLRFMTGMEKDAVEKFARSIKTALGESIVKVDGRRRGRRYRS